MARFLNFTGEYEGITEEKAAKNLEMYGENRVNNTAKRRFKVYHWLLNPWSLILLISVVPYLGTKDYAGAVICLTGAIVIMAVLALLYHRTNEKMDECTGYAKMKYRVIRESRIELIPTAYIVPDDLIILEEGEMVPADAHVLEQYSLSCDESLFTNGNPHAAKKAGFDGEGHKLKSSCIYSGTRVVSGGCIARVFATGVDTARANGEYYTKTEDPDYTGYEKVFAKIKPVWIVGAILLTALGVTLNAVRSPPTEASVWGIKAAGWLICLMPPIAEFFIRSYSVRVARKIRKKGAVIKNTGVLQRLNSLTAIIIDKSAIVTSDKLEVSGVHSKNYDLMVTVSLLAGNRQEPTNAEKALAAHGRTAGVDIAAIDEYELVQSFPYSNEFGLGGNMYRIGDKLLLCIKGEPEKVAQLCDMPAESVFAVQEKNRMLSSKGHEVWASAYTILSDDYADLRSLFAAKYTYMGMVSFISATRDMIALAVKNCARAGVRIVLMTDDTTNTSGALGKRIGLDPGKMVSGERLRSGRVPDFRRVEIISHITDLEKPDVIDAMRKSGEIVAVYGSTNSQYNMMKHSDFGITSLENTSGCIYDAADLITANDSFAAIVDIIKEARQLHRNIKKCLSLCLIVFTALGIMMAADILFGICAINPLSALLFCCVVLPLCAMSFGDYTGDLHKEMTSSGFIGRGVISKSFFAVSMLYGMGVGVVFTLATMLLGSGQLPQASNSIIFIMMSLFTVFCSFVKLGVTDGGRGIPKKSILLLIAVAILSVVIIYVPYISTLLGLGAISPLSCVFSVIIGLLAGFIYRFTEKR